MQRGKFIKRIIANSLSDIVDGRKATELITYNWHVHFLLSKKKYLNFKKIRTLMPGLTPIIHPD
ncbi:hypothetical protein A2526_00265 [candidate division WOR-1 bacterium RIFOXYD2_FULL_36_8]|uniref:Uncharacterized protein n=1 Tax=candidate division WOR-1 bacterium RIFOXYB2_FULL_36_35 TaxID=1802578 RepID=A0A1F4RXW7_UNCSA|nr:MAG: hypothetical protein A2230_08655 [candidate division WOR-1 bacterium RIFOXYA2_FULL_36_21]OGC13028.1 MAG: hypothetical protein A2290_00440 [candidate division WOR-1 bacterium RIFOXYB2_FULL_36_35]OGC21000.1 MAG: hypothetical protein A2282_05790 [candidate division WOR-1 bacterium RIFOXYA12_FULL_36_13]OGC37139.1 MAG: hypothetical protein A2526_00265 [candidate division WOR-1 bacterium RIFOXYD2_FULL_36_8]